MTDGVLNKEVAKAEADRRKAAFEEAVQAVNEAKAELLARQDAADVAKDEFLAVDRVYRMLSGQWGKRKKAKKGAETPE